MTVKEAEDHPIQVLMAMLVQVDLNVVHKDLMLQVKDKVAGILATELAAIVLEELARLCRASESIDILKDG